MKSLLSILLTVCLLVTLISCGAEPENKTEPEKTQTATQEKEDEGLKIPRGEISGNVYKSSFSGLTYTAPENWRFENDSAIANQLGIKESLFQDNLANSLESASEVYDAMATESQSASNVTISYTKAVTPDMSPEDQMKKIKGTLESNPGFEVIFDEETAKVTIGEKEYLRGHAEVEAVGTVTNRLYYVTNVEGVMVTVSFTIFGEYDVASLEATLS